MGVAKSNYVLAENAGEAERLQLLARVWERSAREMLEEIGIQAGWHCVDLGCGALGIVGPLSDAVGKTGRVVGLDNDARQLNAVRDWVRTTALGNVEIVDGDAYATQLPRESFDLVHARFVFAPGGRDDVLLREMLALTRPGAVVAVEEPDTASWGCFPASPAWETLKSAIERVFRAVGGDFNAGRKMFGMFRAAGIEDVQVRAHVLALQPGHPYRRMPLQVATVLRRKIVDAGILSEKMLDEAIASFDEVAADDHTLMTTFTVLQVWGRKPRAMHNQLRGQND